MYHFKFSKKVQKFLEKRDKKFLILFQEKIEELVESPFENFLDIKKLVNTDSHYRLRISKYRFLYEINSDEILIYMYEAGSRGSIYK